MEKIIGAVRQWLSSRKKKSSSAPAAPDGGYKSLRIQPTPNPQACQFVTDRPILREGAIQYDSADDAGHDPFAAALFGLFGIESVFIRESFVTVTKSPVVGWEGLVPQIEAVIERDLRFYEKPPEKPAPQTPDGFREFTPEEFLTFPDGQKEKIINAIFDYAIRPALANDGGGLTLAGVSGSIVKIHYQGACGTCPSSTRGTLQYIEGMLKENLHPDLTVEVQ